jgi:hypothetical protein
MRQMEGELMKWTIVSYDNLRMSAIPVTRPEDAIRVVARLINEGKSVAAVRNGTDSPEVQALLGVVESPGNLELIEQ